jgi:hypothetical protein
LQQDGEVWLPTGKYKSIARDCGVDGVNMIVATRFLHETGAIRFFGDASSILTIEDHNFDEFTRTTSGAIDMLEHTVFISAPWMVIFSQFRSISVHNLILLDVLTSSFSSVCASGQDVCNGWLLM